jgi:transposase
LSCTVAPGNQVDVKALLPVVDRARERFGLTEVCFVADRGMVSRGVIEALEERGMGYIFGMRMRSVKEIGEQVLGHPGRYRKVADNLRVKQLQLGDRRYIVCHNPSQAKKDAEDRAAIVEMLAKKLKSGAKALIGNRGFRRYLSAETGAVRLDTKRIESEARYDGKWVLRTNTALPAEEVALQYKQLLGVERMFRSAKSLLETRPIYHRLDTTITGHIFCSFLALLLMHELNNRIRERGERIEWPDILRDLSSLEEVEVRHHDTHYILRSPVQGVCGKVFQAAGVALPPSVRQADLPSAKTS